MKISNPRHMVALGFTYLGAAAFGFALYWLVPLRWPVWLATAILSALVLAAVWFFSVAQDLWDAAEDRRRAEAPPYTGPERRRRDRQPPVDEKV